MSVPVETLNNSAAIWVEVPAPDEPNEYLPGFFFSRSISSGTVFAGRSILTIRMFGTLATCEIGAKSLM